MPRFPKKEAEIVALAEHLWRGFWVNRPIYQQPPVNPRALHMKTRRYLQYRNDFIAAQATTEAAITAKDGALEELTEAVKANIRYAENTVKFNDDKLKLIGWAGRKAATALQIPGQTRLLEAPRQGNGWVFLDWKAPADGGRPKAYKIQRRNRNNSSWEDVATAVITEATLVEQPRKAELEYRVIAVNKAGYSQPSNTVTAVL